MEFNAKKVKWGIIFMAAGGMLLAHNYGLFSFELSFSRDWPATLIAVGLLGTWDGIFYRGKGKGPKEADPETRKTIIDVLEKIEKGEMSAEEGARKIKN